MTGCFTNRWFIVKSFSNGEFCTVRRFFFIFLLSLFVALSALYSVSFRCKIMFTVGRVRQCNLTMFMQCVYSVDSFYLRGNLPSASFKSSATSKINCTQGYIRAPLGNVFRLSCLKLDLTLGQPVVTSLPSNQRTKELKWRINVS